MMAAAGCWITSVSCETVLASVRAERRVDAHMLSRKGGHYAVVVRMPIDPSVN